MDGFTTASLECDVATYGMLLEYREYISPEGANAIDLLYPALLLRRLLHRLLRSSPYAQTRHRSIQHPYRRPTMTSRQSSAPARTKPPFLVLSISRSIYLNKWEPVCFPSMAGRPSPDSPQQRLHLYVPPSGQAKKRNNTQYYIGRVHAPANRRSRAAR